MMELKVRGRPANQATATRQKLLATAARVFNKDGYHGTDSNKIARAAGLAPATFYRHFADKKQIFLEAYARWVAADWALIEDALRAHATPRATARALVEAHSAHHREWVQFRLSMHSLIATDAEARAIHFRVRAEQIERMRALLAEAGAPPRTAGELLYSFLSIERSLNALTDGDLEALGIAREEVVPRIENEIVFLLTGQSGELAAPPQALCA
jgi:AcrR family transcriptional regulator